MTKNWRFYLILPLSLIMLTSCQALKPEKVDTRKVPISGPERSKKNIETSGLFHFDTINSIWNEHKNGVKDNQNRLWNIMMFQTWYDNYNSRY